MKKLFIYLAALFLFAIPPAVYGCSCAYSTPATAFNDSKAVFIGKMIGGTEKNTVTDQGGTYEIESGDVTFEVGESFKGDPGKTVTIQINSHKGTSCGTYGLTRGSTYLVYAYPGPAESGMMRSGVCTRTSSMLAGGRKEDMDFLRSLPPAGSGGIITGRIWIDTRAATGGGAAPFPGVRVRITGPEGKVYSVVTDRKGEFLLGKLPEGVYRVEPSFPADYYTENKSDDVKVADLGTARTGFEARFDGHISGRAVGNAGVALVLFNSTKLIFMGSTGGNGTFSGDGIPPGEYYLAAEIEDTKLNMTRRYYYPGTFDKRKAITIRVGRRQTVRGIRFVIPKRF